MHKRKLRRAGRRAKAGARTASGQLSRAAAATPTDHGTPHAQRHRMLLANGGAPELAGSAVGILLAYGHLEPRHVAAAWRYAIARAAAFGLARPSACFDAIDISRRGVPQTEESEASARRRFEAMVARLDPEQKTVLDQLMIDGKLPTWFRLAKARRRLRPSDEREQSALRSALEALVRDR
jgi:hypothetical protein